ncbi:MAG: Ldh family oxidoreductase [Betaproteobacteria bacterium]|jgi:LDH2 family malate/lactate/ureidoglycolate dehydrogenase|nr:Ldh family oxidoreductase [Betaproteobacteria bacterium]
MAEQKQQQRISGDRLQAFIASAFEAVDVPRDDAKTIAQLMAQADINGSEGHGVFRLPQYVRRIKGKAINVRPNIRVERELAAMALVHGDNGMGHLVMKFAAEKAIEKAKTAGVAWVGARWSNHAGPASLYATMPLAHNMIGLYMAVGSANHLPPWGGLDMLLSTNPIAVAVPAGDEPAVILDMATTVAAYGKVKTKAQRGEMMPEGWMMDRTGNPLTDPKRANEGFLLPIGGYKGYGLALVIGMLAGNLNAAAMGRDVIDFNNDDTSETNTGHAIVAINIEAFQDLKEFKSGMDMLIRDIRNSQRLPNVDRIRLPGDGTHVARADREKNGVPIPEALLAALDQLAGDLKIAKLPR